VAVTKYWKRVDARPPRDIQDQFAFKDFEFVFSAHADTFMCLKRRLLSLSIDIMFSGLFVGWIVHAMMDGRCELLHLPYITLGEHFDLTSAGLLYSPASLHSPSHPWYRRSLPG
jgi:hypothetical protein